MSEIDKIRETGEKIIWSSKPKFIPYMLPSFLASFIIGILVFMWIPVFGIVIFSSVTIFNYLNYSSSSYAITSRRIIVQPGIGRKFNLIDYDKVKNVSVEISVTDRLFGTGCVRVFSGEIGTPKTSIISWETSKQKIYGPGPVYDEFSNIENPFYAVKILQSNINKKNKTTDVLKSIDKVMKKR